MSLLLLLGGAEAAAEEIFTSINSELPSFRVDIAFETDPSEAPVWTDVSAYVRGWSWSRGRSGSLARNEAGRLDLVLDNRDGHFDPTNTSSAYYPNVLPMRRIRVRAKWNGVIYDRWAGYVEDWMPSWPDNGKNAIVEVRAADAFKILNLSELNNVSYSAQLSGTRMGTVLADAGFTSADYSLDDGQTTIVASGTITETAALNHMQEVAETETGLLFANAGGTVIFQDRHNRILNFVTPSGTIGDTDGEIRYSDVTLGYGDEDIWNTAIVTPSGGTAETYTDTSSTATYMERTLSRSLITADQTEALAAAQYLVSRFKDPELVRVEEVEVRGSKDTDTWPEILAGDISHLYLFRRRPSWGGTISKEEHIEALFETVQVNGDWIVNYRFSLADPQQYWVLDDPVLSVLDSTTKPAY